MPNHVHLVLARYRASVEQVVIRLKGEATRQLEDEHIHPIARFPLHNGRRPKCWARGEWKVFLEDAEDIARAVAYVEQNPIKERLPPQQWRFVKPWREYI